MGSRPSRRAFLRDSAAGAAIGFPTILPGHWRGARAPSERVRVGVIGVGGQGLANVRALRREVAALCDVDRGHLLRAQALLRAAGGGPAGVFDDYRRLLDRADIDAVVVSTPDHWHARATIDACAAGKDVYCEKPLGLTVREGRAMVDAARRHGRIVQTGSQQRSDERFRRACELVRSGRIGGIKEIRVGLPGVNFSGPPAADSPPPAGLDYDFWLGPAPDRPFNASRCHYNFRFFWDYSGGQLTNWGAHHLDIVQWSLDRDDSGPTSVEGTARFQRQGWYEVPEWADVTFRYADGTPVRCGQGYPSGVTFEGDSGTIRVDRGVLTTTPGHLAQSPVDPAGGRLDAPNDHHRDWLDCIRSRARPRCDVAVGHRSATVCHLGNIALRTGRRISWDPAREEILGDPAASALLARPYRAPWRSPVDERPGP